MVSTLQNLQDSQTRSTGNMGATQVSTLQNLQDSQTGVDVETMQAEVSTLQNLQDSQTQTSCQKHLTRFPPFKTYKTLKL